MSLEKTEAIVLRAVEWSETSLVVTLFTEDFGKVSAIAKGARRLKSPFESALDLLSLSSVVFIAKSGDTLDLLTEAKLQRRFRSSQIGLLPLYCGYYAAEFLQTMTENHQPIPGLLELLLKTIEDLDERKDPASVTLRFELHALQKMGLLPSFEVCVGCGESIDTTSPTVALSASGGGVACRRCSPGQRNVLRIEINTLQVLREVSECNPIQELKIVSSKSRGEVRFVMEHVIGHVTERRLRLIDYLEELKR